VLSFRKLTEAEQLLDSQQEAGAADPTTRTVTFTSPDSTAGDDAVAGAGSWSGSRDALRNDSCEQLSSTRRAAIATETPKFGHEMVWKCAAKLDPAE